MVADPHCTGGHSDVPGEHNPGSTIWKVCVQPGVAVSVTVTVNVAPPPAVPGPKVNCVNP